MPQSLLTTKLFVPPVRRDSVPRPLLIERLNAGIGRKLVLVSAPAGYGKTTLPSRWVSQSKIPAGWVSLDAGDNGGHVARPHFGHFLVLASTEVSTLHSLIRSVSRSFSMTEKRRYYDIDWLRVLGMLTIFLFHNARFFNDEDWHVKNSELDYGLSVFVVILNHFIMPLFFVLSAMAIYYALKRRNNTEFIRERVIRLLVPLGVGFASHHLDFSNRFLKYANEAVLPFYILHQTVIVVIGYFIKDWHWAVLPKYVFLATASFVCIMVLYKFAVKRVGALRYLFGMKG